MAKSGFGGLLGGSGLVGIREVLGSCRDRSCVFEVVSSRLYHGHCGVFVVFFFCFVDVLYIIDILFHCLVCFHYIRFVS